MSERLAEFVKLEAEADEAVIATDYFDWRLRFRTAAENTAADLAEWDKMAFRAAAVTEAGVALKSQEDERFERIAALVDDGQTAERELLEDAGFAFGKLTHRKTGTVNVVRNEAAVLRNADGEVVRGFSGDLKRSSEARAAVAQSSAEQEIYGAPVNVEYVEVHPDPAAPKKFFGRDAIKWLLGRKS